MMRKLRQFLILLLFTNVASQLALAETSDTTDATEELKQYDVEIIIFEDAHARYLDSEAWNEDTIKEDIADGDTANKADFESIKPYILSKEYQRIKRSSEFNILQYSAWRQTGLDQSQAYEIDIDDLENNHEKKTGNTISGTVKIVLARYLHFYSKLRYQRIGEDIEGKASETSQSEEAVSQNPENEITAINSYPIETHRRMRSKELHYIDHPLVGILIQINPVDTPRPVDIQP
jgi:hypothetical protein